MRLRPKLYWIAVLYFAEGFPFGVAYDVWPVYFRKHGVSLAEIGLMSLLFLPYTLKPAWAPFVDRLGSRQAWIATCELVLAAITLVILGLDPTNTGWVLWTVLLSFTLFSATQDIAIDAFAVDVSTPKHSGAINGMRVSAYRVGLLASGGLVLILADWLGWRAAWFATAGVMVLMALAVLASPRVPRDRGEARAVKAPAASVEVWRIRLAAVAIALALLALAWWRGWGGLWVTFAVLGGAFALASFLDVTLLKWAFRREMLVVVVFILLYKLPDSTIGRMIKTFWVDQGLSTAEIGVVSYAVGAVLTVAGALVGGAFTTRWGIFKALLWMGIIQAFSNVGYVTVAAVHLPHAVLFLLPNGAPLTWHRIGIYSASMFESFAQGMSTAAFLAFLTNLCDKEHGATQFAILSALFALTRDLAGAVTGFGVQAMGYAVFFAFTALLAIPPLALLPWVRPRIRVGNGDDEDGDDEGDEEYAT